MDTKLLVFNQTVTLLRVFSSCLKALGMPITLSLLGVIMGLVWIVKGLKYLSQWLYSEAEIGFQRNYRLVVRRGRKILEHRSWGLLIGVVLVVIPGLVVAGIKADEIYGQEEEVYLALNNSVSPAIELISTQESIVAPLPSLFLSQGYHPGHLALDFRAEPGTPIHPIMKGKVILVENHTIGYGKHVMIDHGNNVQSLYAHMNDIYVVPDQQVITSDYVGTVGSTGNSTGPHLHLEIIDQGHYINPFSLIGGL